MYSGNIYGAEFNDQYKNVSDDPLLLGLRDLVRDGVAHMDLSTDFYCLNFNRPPKGNKIASTGDPFYDYTPWTLECIIDAAFLSDVNADGTPGHLGEGDYQLTDYAFNIMDAKFAHTGDTVSSSDISYSNMTVPDLSQSEGWANTPVTVYASDALVGDEWVVVDEYTLQDVWAGSNHTTTKVSGDLPDGTLRVKLVYPGSRMMTSIRFNYGIDILADGENVSTAMARLGTITDSSFLTLTSWLNYAAYSESEYAKYPTSPDYIRDPSLTPDLLTDRKNVSGDTGTFIREWDVVHPWPGYNIPEGSDAEYDKYTYRKVVMTYLYGKKDEVGLVATQYLYTLGEGDTDVLLGSPLKSDYDGNPCGKVSDVTNLTKVLYRIQGVALTAQGTDQSLLVDREKIDRDPVTGVVSPFSSKNQRYYVLLPAGLEYVEGSVRTKQSRAGLPTYGQYHEYVTNMSSMSFGMVNPNLASPSWTMGMWTDAGKADVEITTKWVNNDTQQLLIIDRAGYANHERGNSWSTSSDTRFFIGGYDYHWAFVTGVGVEFEARPRVGVDLSAGSYETLYFTQFLDDDLNPISLDVNLYNGDIIDKPSDAKYNGQYVDDFIKGSVPSSVIPVSTSFRNYVGSARSYAELRVKPGEIDHDLDAYGQSAETELDGGAYAYALTYGITSGTSSDVVLWDSIENYARLDSDGNTVRSEWNGVLTDVDTNGTNARVFVNFNAENIDGYLTTNAGNIGASKAWLETGVNGWAEVDPDTYDDWAKVKSIAFWFDGVTFSATDSTKPSSMSVFLRMEAPAGIDEKPGQSVYTTYNELAFSDVHSTVQQNATVLTKSAFVTLRTVAEVEPGGFEMPKTGGTGVIAFYCAGMACLALASYAYVRRRKHDSI